MLIYQGLLFPMPTNPWGFALLKFRPLCLPCQGSYSHRAGLQFWYAFLPWIQGYNEFQLLARLFKASCCKVQICSTKVVHDVNKTWLKTWNSFSICIDFSSYATSQKTEGEKKIQKLHRLFKGAGKYIWTFFTMLSNPLPKIVTGN